MGTILVTATIAKVRADLVDEDEQAWSDADLLEDYNEAIRALCALKVDSYVVRGPLDLEPGVEQTLPTGAVAIFNVLKNTASGKPITLTDQELLDESLRFAAVPASAVDVIHWTADPRDKTRFRVYPPNTGTGSVTADYGAVPDEAGLSTPGDTLLPVGDHNEPAIVVFMMGAAYRRNTLRQDLAKSSGYMQQFLTMLGLSANSQIAVAPKVGQSQGAG